MTDQIPDPPQPAKKGVSVPRLVGGIVLLFLVLVNLANRAQRGETFANGAEASGYLIAMLLFVVAGVWLLVSAFRRR